MVKFEKVINFPNIFFFIFFIAIQMQEFTLSVYLRISAANVLRRSGIC